MRDEANNNVEFVQVVEQYPVLYNNTLPGYCEKEQHDQAWIQVATAVNDSVYNCKERWKNLRACLCRYLRQSPISMSGRSKKPYYLAQHMDYLIPFTKPRLQHRSSISNSNVGDSLQNSSSPVMYNEGMLQQELEEADADESHIDIKPDIRNYEDHQNSMDANDYDIDIKHESQGYEDKNNSDAVAMDGMDVASDRSSSIDTPNSKRVKTLPSVPSFKPAAVALERLDDINDSNLNFLKSLLPDMKEMTPPQKNKFKMSVLKVVNEILYES